MPKTQLVPNGTKFTLILIMIKTRSSLNLVVIMAAVVLVQLTAMITGLPAPMLMLTEAPAMPALMAMPVLSAALMITAEKTLAVHIRLKSMAVIVSAVVLIPVFNLVPIANGFLVCYD